MRHYILLTCLALTLVFIIISISLVGNIVTHIDSMGDLIRTLEPESKLVTAVVTHQQTLDLQWGYVYTYNPLTGKLELASTGQDVDGVKFMNIPFGTKIEIYKPSDPYHPIKTIEAYPPSQTTEFIISDLPPGTYLVKTTAPSPKHVRISYYNIIVENLAETDEFTHVPIQIKTPITLAPGATIEYNPVIINNPGTTLTVDLSKIQTKIILKQENIQLGNGVIIAPHLYNWRFDGVDDYVKVAESSSIAINGDITIEMMFYYLQFNLPNQFIYKVKSDWSSYFYGFRAFVEGNMRIYTNIGNGTYPPAYIHTNTLVHENVWYHYVLTLNNTIAKVYVNGELDNTKDLALTLVNAEGVPLRINVDKRMNGYIAFVRIYNRALGADEISASYNNHVIDATGLVLFLDPTFYNGTHYVDLSGNGNHGTPYGGVQRVPAEDKWLWVVENAGDGLVHFRFMPKGTVVHIIDRVTGADYSYMITGTPNQAGLIEDYAIPIPTPNPVDITIEIPKTITIAPHLYNWHFDGQDDYIEVPNSASITNFTQITIEVLAWLTPYTGNPRDLFDHGYWNQPYGYICELAPKYNSAPIYLKNTDGNVVASSISYTPYKWIYFGVTWDGAIAKWFKNGTIVASKDFSGTLACTSYNLYLAVRFTKASQTECKIALFRIYNRSLTDSEILSAYDNHIINVSGLVLFLDPTFYNGTHYVDLSGNGNHGTPYGGVQRVPAEDKWLWVVDEGVGGGVVHFRFFPAGSIIYLLDKDGNVIDTVRVDGEANNAGLIEDYAIPIPDGVASIKAVLFKENQQLIKETPREKLSTPQLALTLTLNNVALAGNTTIAPHLWDWYAKQTDDSSDYIDYEGLYMTMPFDMEVGYKTDLDFSADLPNVWYFVIRTYNSSGAESARLGAHGWGNKFEIDWFNTSGYRFGVTIPASSPASIYGHWENGNFTISDGTSTSSNTNVFDNLKTDVRRMVIYLTYTSVLSYSTRVEYIYAKDSSRQILLDPTFFNGTHYFDLITGAVGTPHGDVQRVPAEQKWLWMVNNAGSDGLVHLRFFPYGSVVEFVNATTGELVERIYINGTPNQAGMVEDTPVSLPEGQYTVKSIIPKHVTIAPHLFDVVVPRSSTVYIKFDAGGLPRFTGGSLMAWLRAEEGTSGYGWADVIRLDGDNGRLEMYFKNGQGNIRNIIYNNSQVIQSQAVVPEGFVKIAGYLDPSVSQLYFNGTLVDEASGSIDMRECSPIAIMTAHNYKNCDIKYTLSASAIWVNRKYIANTTIIEKPDFLFDPTFYNGTHYINLVNESIVGTPYGGVQRVPAEDKWLWVVDEGYGLDNITLKWVPRGSWVYLYDVNGTLVWEGEVDSNDTVVVDGVEWVREFVVPVELGVVPGRVVVDVVPGNAVYLVGFPKNSRVYLVSSAGNIVSSTTVEHDPDVLELPTNTTYSGTLVVEFTATKPPMIVIDSDGSCGFVYWSDMEHCGRFTRGDGRQHIVLDSPEVRVAIYEPEGFSMRGLAEGLMKIASWWVPLLIMLTIVAIFVYTRRR